MITNISTVTVSQTHPEIVLVPLDRILPNPYQAEEENPEEVKKLALSIASCGLLQEPVGRLINGDGPVDITQANYPGPADRFPHPYKVQLAFGHTRLAAFEWLEAMKPHSNLVGDWSHIPVKIRQLTDREMFELAVRENNDRKIVSPITKARQMQTYRDVFQASSAEIARLFHMSDSGVRQLLRLLELPEGVQEKVNKGEISQPAARTLLTVQRIAPQAAEPLAEKIAAGDANPAAVANLVDSALRSSKDTVILHNSYDSPPARGGKGLWILKDWSPEPLDQKKISNLTGLKKDQVEEICTDLVKSPETVAQEGGLDQTQVEQVFALANPTTCPRCPFYAVVGGVHYCGFKACHKSRKAAFIQVELERIAAELDIAIYDPKADGKTVEEYISYRQESKTKFEAWLAERADHLRLRIQYNDWQKHAFTDSHIVELVSINDAYLKKAEKEKADQAKRQERQAQEDEQRERKWENRKKAQEFVRQVAAPVFAPTFAKLELAVLDALANAIDGWRLSQIETPTEPGERRSFLQHWIAYHSLHGEIPAEIEEQGPIAVSRHLEAVAQAWKRELPGDWFETAEQFGK